MLPPLPPLARATLPAHELQNEDESALPAAAEVLGVGSESGTETSDVTDAVDAVDGVDAVDAAAWQSAVAG